MLVTENSATVVPENNTEGSPSEKPGAADAAQANPAATTEQQAADQKTATDKATADKAEAGKTDDGKADAEGKKEGEADKSKEEPVELTDFTVPEGVKLDAEATKEFKTIAKELGLKQEGAQKVAEIGVKMAQKWAAQQNEAIKATHEGWIESSKTDKEFGGDKLDQNLAVAKKALDDLGTPELKALLKESGLENHPEMIRILFRAGKQISEEGRHVSGRATSDKGKSDAHIFYPNLK